MAKSTTPISARLEEEADRHIRKAAYERNVKPSQVIQEMYEVWANQTHEPEPQPTEPAPQPTPHFAPDNDAEQEISLPDNLEADFQKKQTKGKAKNRHNYLLKLYKHAKKWFF